MKKENTKIRSLIKKVCLIKRLKSENYNKKSIQRTRFLVIFQLFIIFALILQLTPKKEKELKYGARSVVDDTLYNKKEFLNGLNNILISKENINFLSTQNSSCVKGDILGAYFDDIIIVKDSGPEVNKHTLFHEIGHNIWKKLNNSKKEEWIALYGTTDNFVTPYASTSPNEDFAENFACHFTNFENCTSKIMIEKKFFVDNLLMK